MRHSFIHVLTAIGMAAVVGVASERVGAQSRDAVSSRVSALVAKADFQGSSAEEIPAPDGQRSVRIHLQNKGTYGSGLTVVTVAYPLGWRTAGAMYRAGLVQASSPAYGPVLAWTLPDVAVGAHEEAVFTFEQAQLGGDVGVSFVGQNGRVEYARLRFSPKLAPSVPSWKHWFGLST